MRGTPREGDETGRGDGEQGRRGGSRSRWRTSLAPGAGVRVGVGRWRPRSALASALAAAFGAGVGAGSRVRRWHRRLLPRSALALALAGEFGAGGRVRRCAIRNAREPAVNVHAPFTRSFKTDALLRFAPPHLSSCALQPIAASYAVSHAVSPAVSLPFPPPRHYQWSLRPLVSEIVETTDLSNLKIFPSNISGTYKGTWEVARNSSSSRFPDLQKNSGNIIFQLKTSSTARPEVHYVHGEVVLRDGMYISDGDVHMKLEGVYLRPFGHLRMVLSSSAGADSTEVDEESAANGYQLELHDSSKRGQGSPDHTAVVEMARNCKIRMITHVSPAVWEWRNGVQEHVPTYLSPSSHAPSSHAPSSHAPYSRAPYSHAPALLFLLCCSFCFYPSPFYSPLSSVATPLPSIRTPLSSILTPLTHPPLPPPFCLLLPLPPPLPALSPPSPQGAAKVSMLMVGQQAIMDAREKHEGAAKGAAKVSMLMVGQQAIMDAYLCLLHLTAGIVVGAESLFNAFATAAFFKFVIFSIFEMRYLLAIWKARRPAQSSESWDLMRRELSILYSRFCECLIDGKEGRRLSSRGNSPHLPLQHSPALPAAALLLLLDPPDSHIRYIRDSRKPLHVHYILGMSATRLAIPLYIFGCPKNFMRVEPSPAWCAALIAFMGAQVVALLLQHYLGPRWFIPKQFLPEKYSYFRRVSCLMRQSSDADDSGPADCVICMTPVPITSHSMDRMVTPCDHMFHTACLQRWMDIKMECPTCRRCLPPV
ncbi:unnamed protein product [Closterium sp. Naga37s-1]|nr:unnamed protein product [Closterium sp. Naga37s-1]